jgi:hypothetical protein
LAAALRVWAKGLLSAEAAVELLVGHRLWLFVGIFSGSLWSPVGRYLAAG